MPNFWAISPSRVGMSCQVVVPTTHPQALHWMNITFTREPVGSFTTISKWCFPHFGQDDIAICNPLI